MFSNCADIVVLNRGKKCETCEKLPPFKKIHIIAKETILEIKAKKDSLPSDWLSTTRMGNGVLVEYTVLTQHPNGIPTLDAH